MAALSGARCAVCDDYGVYRGTTKPCPHDRFTLRDGRALLLGHDTAVLAGRWFAGESTDAIAASAGLTREQLAVVIEYEAHRPEESP